MDTIEIFPLFKPKRASEEIANSIRTAILSKKLKEGDRLPAERVLAKRFGVGRLTIREAFRVLEERGLIQIKKGNVGGAFVASADAGREDIASIIMDNLELSGISGQQIAEARHILGDGIVRLIIEYATTDELDAIEEYIGNYETVSDPEDIRELVSDLIDFHILLAEASHNVPLIVFMRTLMEWARRKLVHWFPSEDEQLHIFKSHREILKSLKSKDVELAQKNIKNHIKTVSERLIRLRLS